MTGPNSVRNYSATPKKYAAIFLKTAGATTIMGGSLAGSIMLAGAPAGILACVTSGACVALMGAAPMESADKSIKRTMKIVFLGAASVGGLVGGFLSGDALGGAVLAPAAIAAASGLGVAIMSPAERLAPDLDKFQRPTLPFEGAFKTAVTATLLGGMAFGAYMYKQDTLAFVEKVRQGSAQVHIPTLSK